ncbi:hypothetical protein EDD90_2767 [Streptomyces sp. Ag109_O5-1]|uniref:hypothetical protein n=1 Tax=Streptomyces sp. Ag109_O5-1 TaxID=1938851 RepID=UPI000F93DAC4|nr:hypothetical protein [Streptomyces sp. Ag109_O5-1]RPE39750.1 hypothetical protein EDD90_2767 [Streptomyces sp. Ag109_O5-1]
MSAPLENVTQETLDAIQKAQTTGILTGTGVYSYDLSGLVNLIPVHTPFRDIVARVKSTDGNPYAVWRAIMNTTNAQPDPSMGFDYAANEVIFAEQDFQAKYKPTGLAGMATQDAFDLGTGYADPFQVATFQTLNQVIIGDDRKLLGAQSFALARPAAPTIVQSATGGTIGAVTVYVGVAARTGSGYYYGSGNSQGNSASTTFASGTANSLTATVGAVRGAVAYDWFQSANGTTWYYYSTSTVNTIQMTKVIAANQALPTGPTVPDLTSNWQGTLNTVPTFNAAADNGSANANDYDGFMATLSGDYNSAGQWVQPGTGTANPSTFKSLDGAALTLSGGSVAEIENYVFLPLWNAIKSSPTALMMNAQQAQEIANLVLGSSSATTFLNTDQSGRISVTAGGRVGEIVNAPAGGITVPIEVHTSLPPGTIVARTDRVPFPQANVTNVLEYRNLRDTAQFDYGVSRVAGVAGGGPRREFEIRSVGAFVNRAPVAMATLSNVG